MTPSRGRSIDSILFRKRPHHWAALTCSALAAVYQRACSRGRLGKGSTRCTSRLAGCPVRSLHRTISAARNRFPNTSFCVPDVVYWCVRGLAFVRLSAANCRPYIAFETDTNASDDQPYVPCNISSRVSTPRCPLARSIRHARQNPLLRRDDPGTGTPPTTNPGLTPPDPDPVPMSCAQDRVRNRLDAARFARDVQVQSPAQLEPQSVLLQRPLTGQYYTDIYVALPKHLQTGRPDAARVYPP